MDPQMMNRLLQSYGAANTAENANKAREFFAANPDVAERRAMGMRGSGNEDNSDILKLQSQKELDDIIARSMQTDAPAGRVEVGAPEVQQAMPTVQNAAAPTRQSATAAPYGPNQPMAQGAVNPLDAPAGGATPPQQGSFWDWLLPVLIGGGAIAAGSRMGPPKEKAQPRAIGEDGKLLENPYPDGQKRLTYEPKLQDQSGPRYASGANEIDTSLDTKPQTQKKPPVSNEEQARRNQMQAEIDAENASAKSLQEQMMQQNKAKAKAQANTRETLKAAKSTLRGSR